MSAPGAEIIPGTHRPAARHLDVRDEHNSMPNHPMRKMEPMTTRIRETTWSGFAGDTFRLVLRIAAMVATMSDPLVAATPTVATQIATYYPNDDIFVQFAGGPGNFKDRIAVFPANVEPGSGTPPTIWKYVDGTDRGTDGVLEGTVRFAGGVLSVGAWKVFLLENGGDTPLAMNTFEIVDPATPSVRSNQREYAPREPIVVRFNNGPGGQKDWLAIFKVGDPPDTAPFLDWLYVDGSREGVVPSPTGSVIFPDGLDEPGEYVVYLLLDDGYEIFGSAPITVAAPASKSLRLLKWRPVDGSRNLPPELVYSATIASGPSPIVLDSVVLTLDGSPVPAQVTGDGQLVTIDDTSPDLPGPDSVHTWVLTAPDGASPPNVLRVETTTTIGHYRNIVLPAPFYIENFELATQGGLPDDWTQKSYTTPVNDVEDFKDLGSATYGRWAVVVADWFLDSFVTYGNPDNPPEWGQDYRRVLSVNPFNVLNGQIYREPMGVGRFLFANSHYANANASQVLYLFSPDIDISGQHNVHLVFNSLWEQNEDSIAAVEYSIDHGATWLPLAYFLDGADIVSVTNAATGAVSTDAVATFGQEHDDVAHYVDEKGVPIGGNYGAFIGAPISQSLAPFIQARVDDDPVESKRIEMFALPAAANQATVQFRFTHAGTDSWYFGIDDFGLYSLPEDPTTPPELGVARDGGAIRLTWTGTLQAADDVTGPWSPQPGLTSPASVPIPGGHRFFRTVHNGAAVRNSIALEPGER